MSLAGGDRVPRYLSCSVVGRFGSPWATHDGVPYLDVPGCAAADDAGAPGDTHVSREGDGMPYIKIVYKGAAPTTTYMQWAPVVAAGLRRIVGEALEEPGVASVELTDDAGSRVLVAEKPRDLLALECGGC